MALKLGSNDTAILAGSSVVKQMLLGSSPKFAAPVLDHVPGAAAAYSLRRLSNAYSGPVVKVRRSSDSTTEDFTAAEVVDGTLEAWVGAGDGFVDTWYDQSGNERNAVQTTAGYQPKLVSSGTLVTEGGKPALQFDGADDYIATSSSVSFASVSAFACVVHRDGGSYWKRIVNAWTSTSVGGWFLGRYSSTNAIEFRLQTQAADGTFLIPDASLSDGERCLLSAIYGDADAALLKDGATEDSANGLPGSFAASSVISIGGRLAAENCNLVIQELIIYDSDVSASRELAEGEMAWHYGLQSKLPYNHAYAPQALGGASQTVPTDSDVLAFAAASGAKSIPDLNKIEDLVTYLKAQGLWNYARFYPMKSAQNAGTGSTVYGLGGLTSNNMTLVNSPTWGSDGVTFDAASSQCGRISDFLSGGVTLSAWWRGTNPTGNPLLAQYDYGITQRAFHLKTVGARTVSVALSPNGSALATYYDGYWPTDDATVSSEMVEGGGHNLWVDKEVRALSLAAGTEQTTRLDATADVTVACLLAGGAPTNFESSHCALAGFIETAITTTQRENITDLINAL